MKNLTVAQREQAISKASASFRSQGVSISQMEIRQVIGDKVRVRAIATDNSVHSEDVAIND